MLYVSELLLQHREISTFEELVTVVRARAGSEMFFRMDLKPPYPDTPDNWERVLEAAFNDYEKQQHMNKREHRLFNIDSAGVRLSEQERKIIDQPPAATIESRLAQLEKTLDNTPHPDTVTRASLELDISGLLLDLDRKEEAHQRVRTLIEPLLAHDRFEDAALACQYVYLCHGDDAVAALGQAAWLAVSYPIDPSLTANILDHIVDETPDDADGAAVAAATAHYVADLRAGDTDGEELRLFTGAMLARVARRHSNIQSQDEFEAWVDKLELDHPDRFLIRLRNVIDVMVQDDWWFDREQLQREFTDH